MARNKEGKEVEREVTIKVKIPRRALEFEPRREVLEVVPRNMCELPPQVRQVPHVGVIKKQIDKEAVMEFQRKKDLKFHILGNHINIVIFLEKGGISDEFT